MKKLLVIAVLGMLFSSAGGCRIGECWREAWNSRFGRQESVMVCDPCVVSDPCGTSCPSACSPCGSDGGATTVVPGPVTVQ